MEPAHHKRIIIAGPILYTIMFIYNPNSCTVSSDSRQQDSNTPNMVVMSPTLLEKPRSRVSAEDSNVRNLEGFFELALGEALWLLIAMP